MQTTSVQLYGRRQHLCRTKMYNYEEHIARQAQRIQERIERQVRQNEERINRENKRNQERIARAIQRDQQRMAREASQEQRRIAREARQKQQQRIAREARQERERAAREIRWERGRLGRESRLERDWTTSPASDLSPRRLITPRRPAFVQPRMYDFSNHRSNESDEPDSDQRSVDSCTYHSSLSTVPSCCPYLLLAREFVSSLRWPPVIFNSKFDRCYIVTRAINLNGATCCKLVVLRMLYHEIGFVLAFLLTRS